MSDQQKPTTGRCDCSPHNHYDCEYCRATKHQPKPTGEWTTTAEKDGDCAIVIGTTLIGVGCTLRQTLNIVAAHNAALAAERSYGSAVTGASISAEDEIQQLRDQLTAEQKAHKVAYELWQLAEKQLAAERELVSDAAAQILSKQLQLDAAVEALNTVWKALDNPKFDSWDAKELRKPLGLLLAKYRNNAALAKVEERKLNEPMQPDV